MAKTAAPPQFWGNTVKVLRRVTKHILAEPRRFAMDAYISKGEPGTRFDDGGSTYWNAHNKYESGQTFPDCGTIACIGGWIALLRKDGEWLEETSKLVSADGWPEPFRSRYHKAKRPLTRVKIAVARIDHFIATKGAE